MSQVINENDARAFVAEFALMMTRLERTLTQPAVTERLGRRSGRRLPDIGGTGDSGIDGQTVANPLTLEQRDDLVAAMREAAEKASRTEQWFDKMAILAEAVVPAISTVARLAGLKM